MLHPLPSHLNSAIRNLERSLYSPPRPIERLLAPAHESQVRLPHRPELKLL
jgi:hypothetical protein